MNYTDSYNSIHKWLAYNYGKASKCEQCGTKDSTKYEYALLKCKRHQRNRGHYRELCARCHKEYDQIIEKLTEKKYKPVYATKDGKQRYFPSIKAATLELGVSGTSISNNLSGLSKTAGGYIWNII